MAEEGCSGRPYRRAGDARRVAEFRSPREGGIEACRSHAEVAENHRVPLVDVRFLIRAGSAADPPGLGGLANWVASTLAATAGPRSAAQTATDLARLGATLEAGARPDFSFLKLDVQRESLSEALDIVADAALYPRFAEPDSSRVRDLLGEHAKRDTDKGLVLAEDTLRAALFGSSHGYGHPALGRADSIAKLSSQDALDFYRTNWTPENAAFVVSGDVTAEELKAALEQLFGAWATPPSPAPARPASTLAPSKFQVLLVDRPNAKQASVVAGHSGLPRASPEWTVADVMNRAFAGVYASRLNLNIRESKGYTYNVRSQFTENMEPGYFMLRSEIAIDKVALAVKEILNEMNQMKTNPPRESELQQLKDGASLGLATKLETNSAIADALTGIAAFRLPLDYLDRYVSEVGGLSSSQIGAASEKYLRPADLTVVVAGPAEKIESQFAEQKIGPVRRQLEHLTSAAADPGQQ